MTGPLPPPAGGISIHLERLSRLMKDTYIVDWIDESPVRKKGYFNIRSINLFRYFGKLIQADLIFIHSGNRFFKKLHLIFGRLFFKKIIMTIHGYGPRRNFILRTRDQSLFRLAHHIILVNESIHQKLRISRSKSSVRHAFLPPEMATEPDLPNTLVDKIRQFKSSGATIICVNASSLDSFEGKDLYGLDMCISLAKDLREQNIQFLLIFNVTTLHIGQDRFVWGMNEIKEQNIEDCMLLMNENLSFVKLIEASDIMLRPTQTDGDALSVREALYLGRNVLASDAVERPEGVMLYQKDNQADLLEKTIFLINQRQNKTTDARLPYQNYFDFYDQLIQKILNR